MIRVTGSHHKYVKYAKYVPFGFFPSSPIYVISERGEDLRDSKMQREGVSNVGWNGSGGVKGCIKSSKGPWVVRRSRNGATVTKYRYPSERERQNNRERERNRRAVAHKIFAGLRAHGNYYQLSRNPDSNDLLRALCQEAGWHVEDDGTIFRNQTPGFELGSAARSPVCMATLQQPAGDHREEDDRVRAAAVGDRNSMALEIDQLGSSSETGRIPAHLDLNLSLSLS